MLKNFKLGDKVESVIKAVVPNVIIKKVQGKTEEGKEPDCGCAKRKQWLNNLTFLRVAPDLWKLYLSFSGVLQILHYD